MIEDHPPGAAAAADQKDSSTRAWMHPFIALVAGAAAAAGGIVGWATDSLILVVVGALIAAALSGLLASRGDRATAAPPKEVARVSFIDRSDQTLGVAERHRRKAGIISIRVHGIDAIGASVGEDALSTLRNDLLIRIRTALRSSDDVTLVGKDTFAVLLAEVRDDGSLPIVVEKILDRIQVPLPVGGTQVELRGVAGAALHPEHGETALSLLSMADRALRVAERAKMDWVLYSSRIDRADDDQVTLASGLNRALDGEELVLHYQPQVDLRDGRVRSVEVLLRWEHPERGTLYPPEFLAVVENSSVIRGLARFVLEGALSQCARWLSDGMDLRVAVNLSGRNLLDPHLPTVVADLLARWQLDPARLEIEISEGDLPDAGRSTFAVLQKLHELGVRVTIDDFGTGSADLALLRHLPVDQIKIDRSFVLTMDADDDYGTIVRSSIAIARRLGVEVAAEGVETERVWEELIDLRCDAAQGYFVSRPVPANKLFGGRPPFGTV
jgi:EAL domain-containing protein (putative c-di-GMP-specific phosphodiesterase class I)